ncbi:hypothetical protein AGMMS49574_11700 [Bacteroidia bacterium]|nr:hypothetical protein AGMMS49574_11700 [Bacteroidia bacterium]
MIPQIIAKGSILKQWNKKQVIALQTAFYDTLPPLPEVDKADADFTQSLQKRLDARRLEGSNIDNLENVVVE